MIQQQTLHLFQLFYLKKNAMNFNSSKTSIMKNLFGFPCEINVEM